MALKDHAKRPIDSMYCDSVLVQPQAFDFSEGYGETWDLVYPDPEAMTLKEMRDYLDEQGVEIPCPDPWYSEEDQVEVHEYLLEHLGYDRPDEEPYEGTIDELREELAEAIWDGNVGDLDEWREAVREAFQENGDDFSPMMNYQYELPHYRGDAGADQWLLQNHAGPVALVTVNDETFLALTGGGMDLSFEICASFLLLGYLPPLHFAGNVPRMFSNGAGEDSIWVLKGCLRSAEVAKLWASRAEEDIRNLMSRLEAATA